MIAFSYEHWETGTSLFWFKDRAYAGAEEMTGLCAAFSKWYEANWYLVPSIIRCEDKHEAITRVFQNEDPAVWAFANRNRTEILRQLELACGC